MTYQIKKNALEALTGEHDIFKASINIPRTTTTERSPIL